MRCEFKLSLYNMIKFSNSLTYKYANEMLSKKKKYIQYLLVLEYRLCLLKKPRLCLNEDYRFKY